MDWSYAYQDLKLKMIHTFYHFPPSFDRFVINPHLLKIYLSANYKRLTDSQLFRFYHINFWICDCLSYMVSSRQTIVEKTYHNIFGNAMYIFAVNEKIFLWQWWGSSLPGLCTIDPLLDPNQQQRKIVKKNLINFLTVTNNFLFKK